MSIGNVLIHLAAIGAPASNGCIDSRDRVSALFM